MSEKMTCMSFGQLMDWVLTEHKEKGTVFGVHRAYQADTAKDMEIFGRNLETPIGPAAGPNTQLAQNIVASYYAGARFFELKTVQKMDGDELAACINRPCILAEDECYNCEWSTELYVPQAMGEYIKAWFILHVMAKEFGLGGTDGFQFNISVGYDLAGIKEEKIDTFINCMKEARDTEVFKECRTWLLDHVDQFEHVTKEDIEAIPSEICNSATISTLHGCPPNEIESIANHLYKEKHLNTFIKCNPTLLGYEFARKTMDEMGYDYMAFGGFHFLDDLQYKDAVPMFKRLQALADQLGLAFGVKITNTFPVDVTRNELPSEEMYMSGKSLYPLSIALAAKLSKEFDGKLRISYSGGADAFNIDKIVKAGIWPVTVATTLLKPGGYQRLEQLALATQEAGVSFNGIFYEAVQKLADEAVTDKHHVKAVKPLPSRKLNRQVPLTDCFVAPCKEGCPIHQDITAYLQLVGEGKMKEAMEVITEKNPLPFITGTICAHNCMSKCTRNFYEHPVHIRNAKLTAAEGGFADLMKNLKARDPETGKTAAIVGGGPAGMAAAFFLSRAGFAVTLYEKEDSLGGVVKHVIPGFRISDEAIAHDVALVTAYGAKLQLNTKIENLDSLKDAYDYVVLAAGASEPGVLKLEKGDPVNALEFLADFKKHDGNLDLGKNVVVIGGGNTAMDTARAAKRTKGVEHVYLVYRRTKRYMPADEEELQLAIEDGVEFLELLAPVGAENGKLKCSVMELGAPDASGRRSPVDTGRTEEYPADTIIAAIGETIDTTLYAELGVEMDAKGRPVVDANMMTTEAGVYAVGDSRRGPATVVEAIADSAKAAAAIAGISYDKYAEEKLYTVKKGVQSRDTSKTPDDRCLGCPTVCEVCTDVCPNRANVAIHVPGKCKAQIIHVDGMCNECGNCEVFCPYKGGRPYKDKFTLYWSEEDFLDSTNEGFLPLEGTQVKVRLDGKVETVDVAGETDLSADAVAVIRTVLKDYAYLIH